MLLNVFLSKWVPVWEKNIKMLLENSNLHFTIKTIVHCRKHHLHNCNRDLHLHIYNKNCYLHIWCRKCHLHSAAETSNSIITTETVTWMITMERSTNITVTEITICIVAIEPQNLHNCKRYCHLQNWLCTETWCSQRFC